MAVEDQIIYGYSAVGTIPIKTSGLKITYHRWGMKHTIRPDGKTVTSDPGIEYRKFMATGVITGVKAKELNDVQMTTIVYDATYPRLVKIYFTGAQTEANIEVAILDGDLTTNDKGNGWWDISVTFTERLV